jgi:hypothetical protein
LKLDGFSKVVQFAWDKIDGDPDPFRLLKYDLHIGDVGAGDLLWWPGGLRQELEGEGFKYDLHIGDVVEFKLQAFVIKMIIFRADSTTARL